MSEEKALTLYEVEQMKLKRLAETDDPDEVLKLTDSVIKLHDAQVNESVKIQQTDNECQRVNIDREKLKNDILGIVIGSSITATGVVVGNYVRERTKGVCDDIFQEHGYEHEKTDAVIYNYRKHRR